MDFILLTLLSLLLILAGIIGSIFPVLPGTPLAWLGFLAFKFTPYADYDWVWVIVGAIIMIITVVLEYVIPSVGTKKMGGSKYGIWGSMVGLIIGLFFPPVGFLIGPFLGAFAGEIIHNKEDKKRALKAAIGTFFGFLTSVGLNLFVCFAFLGKVLIDIVSV